MVGVSFSYISARRRAPARFCLVSESLSCMCSSLLRPTFCHGEHSFRGSRSKEVLVCAVLRLSPKFASVFPPVPSSPKWKPEICRVDPSRIYQSTLQFSIDIQDNNTGHCRGNVRITWLECNRRRRLRIFWAHKLENKSIRDKEGEMIKLWSVNERPWVTTHPRDNNSPG